jgi:hypothetical protein
MLWWPSSSSNIFKGSERLTGLAGQRLYLLVTDGRDIPRAGAALAEYLWAAGHGYCTISSSGSLLDRCLVDSSVWQSNRIDFAAGAHCSPPLEQRRGQPVLIPGKSDGPLDTKSWIPEPSSKIRDAAKVNRRAERGRLEPERQRVRDRYIQSQAQHIIDRLPIDRRSAAAPDVLMAQVKEQVRTSLDGGVLFADWPLLLEEGETITVAQALDDPSRYHGTQLLDPLEPDYDRGRVVAKLYLYGRHRIHSFAHGGRWFRLVRQAREIEIQAGNSRGAIDETLELMRGAGEFYDFGDALAVVGDDGAIRPQGPPALLYYVGGAARYFRLKRDRSGQLVREYVDPPDRMLRSLLDIGRARGLRQLRTVVTAPTIRPDGSVLSQPGFDAQTGLLVLTSDHLPEIPTCPTLEQCSEALARLWEPFSEFPFVGPIDRAVHLAALLTACVRPILKTAPAFGYDAPVQGSGKTLLAMSVGALASDQLLPVWPHVGAQGDEEIRKRLFAGLREGAPVIIWDNVTGVFDSAALAALLTSEKYRDRELGKSQTSEVPNAATFIITGNNLRLAGDLPRRVMVCRIDPATESPLQRKFSTDPLAYVRARRQSMVAAALTLMRGWLSSGNERFGNPLASFEQWDHLVRQTVLWVAAHVAESGKFGDPVDSVLKNVAVDPETEVLGELLEAWVRVFGEDRPVRANELVKLVDATSAGAFGTDNAEHSVMLRDALTALCWQKGRATATNIGKALGYRKHRRVAGRWLDSEQDRTGVMVWFVRSQRPEDRRGCRGLQGMKSICDFDESDGILLKGTQKAPQQSPASPGKRLGVEHLLGGLSQEDAQCWTRRVAWSTTSRPLRH